MSPRGPTNFGWDPIFEPAGRDLTYAQMDKDDKNEISHRGRALGMLKVTRRGEESSSLYRGGVETCTGNSLFLRDRAGGGKECPDVYVRW